MMNEQHLAAYRAARERAAFADISTYGWLRLTGRDRLDLLHRLSTNDLKKLGPGQGAPTVLTSAVGRVMAFITVYAGEDVVFVHTMPGQAAGVTRYLTSMIFWQDEVQVVNLTPGASQFAFFGPEASSTLQSLAAEAISGLAPYGWRTATVAGAPASVHRGGPLDQFAWLLDLAPSVRQTLEEQLRLSVPQLDDETVDVLRIEAGLPAWGRELSEQVTPLETGLLAAISFNKGCYTGQEVIARQTNYDKVTRNLVGLELLVPGDSPLLEKRVGQGSAAEAIASVRGPGRGGFVSSVAYSPSLDKVIALAVVPRELAQPGTEVEVVHEEQPLKATVRGLPFIATPGSVGRG